LFPNTLIIPSKLNSGTFSMLLLRISNFQSVLQFLTRTNPVNPHILSPSASDFPNFGCYFLHSISQDSLHSNHSISLCSYCGALYRNWSRKLTVITLTALSLSTRGNYRSEDVPIKSASKASRVGRGRKQKIYVL